MQHFSNLTSALNRTGHITARRQKGLSLLEVLVSLVLLSIGLLGLAGLQATALKSGHSASLRSQATILAYDILDEMRANSIQASAGSFDSATYPARLAWDNRAKQLLGASTTTTVTTTNGREVVVSIQWDDSRGTVRDRAATTTVRQTFTFRTELSEP